jgi:hypothetical protein
MSGVHTLEFVVITVQVAQQMLFNEPCVLQKHMFSVCCWQRELTSLMALAFKPHIPHLGQGKGHSIA